MGLPICRRLISAGFPVAATDLAGPPSGPLEARWAGSAAEACSGADIAVTVLAGPDEVAAIADEITGALAPGSSWLDLSTASPAVSRVVGRAAGAREVEVVDGPMGGGPEEAAAGRLLLFAGGSLPALDACRPVLDVVARRVIHVGPAGSGYAVKLLVNALWFGQAVATAEALALARRLGLDADTVLGALQESPAGGQFLKRHAARLLEGDDLRAFPLARCAEELDSVLALGSELGVSLSVAGAVSEIHRAALEHYGDVDGELLGARWVAERSGVQLGPEGFG
jgi:3-hydroxyisobutyrate dehydrogenase